MAVSSVKGSLVNHDFPQRRVDTATWAGYYVREIGKNIINISFTLLGAQQMQPVVLILDKL